MSSKTLFKIVEDFDRLYDAYSKGGLIGDGHSTEMAKKLLGGGEDIARFRREFLLVDAYRCRWQATVDPSGRFRVRE
jgi:hypothetical protein